MTNKPMLSVERELLERAASAIEKHHGSLQWVIATELRALLDNQAAQHQGDPVAWLNIGTGHVTTSEVVVMDWDDEKEQVQALYAEHPAPVAGQAQCEECKGWGYHENHHEGGGTECGECGGSGNATVAVVMPDVDELAQIIRKVDGSRALGAGSLAEAILEEVARLNGVKP